MLLSEIIRLVSINIRQNKFKVFLTSLGIIVGSATIVLVIAIGEGGKQDVAEQFKTLNAGTITVSTNVNSMMSSMMSSMGGSSGMTRPNMSSSGGSGGSSGASSGRNSMSSGGMSIMSSSSSSSVTLSQADLDDLLFFVPNITTGAISSSSSKDVLSDNLDESKSYSIVGTTPSYQQISNLTTLIGTFITDDDIDYVTRGVILGNTVAGELFSSLDEAYDAKIQIDGRDYVVNGVLAPMGSVVSGISPDTSIFMPYSTAEKYIFDRVVNAQFSILANDVDAVDGVMENIDLVLKQSNPGTTFSITDAGVTMEAAMQSANTLSMLLLAVAVIVFIVGGIGIMNVLFVSVNERTREIGVLKAIGTRKLDILMLFIIEANMIGVIGGILGVLLSLGLIPQMHNFDITAILTPSAVILALVFAIATGTIFGFYPAFKASNLIPIEALNNE